MRPSTAKRVLISGASFAGLSAAWWMRQLGHEVTLVEISSHLRTGGTAVNIGGNTVDIVKRMGIFEQIRAHRMNLARWDFKNADDVTVHSMAARPEGAPPPDDAFEIERNVLLGLLFGLVRGDAEFIFDDRITGLSETGDAIEVTFARSAPRAFDFVLGCDGIHSAVRRMWFGHEAEYSHFLEQYFSISIVDKLLIERDTAQMFNVPGKAVMLNAYQDKTDVILCFVSEREIAYDHRNEAQQRGIIAEQFAGVGWRSAELLKEVAGSTSFYFDKLCQIRMPSWTKGRVALVGDSAYCPSPAAGMGGSLAIDGAAALGEAMTAHPDDLALAFRDYDARLRPFVEQVQAEAVRVGLEMLVPRTEEAIRKRNEGSGQGF